MQITMKNLNSLKQEMYSIWYHETDSKRKKVFKKVLNLIDSYDKMVNNLRSINNLFATML
jgi:hypothetical protein